MLETKKTVLTLVVPCYNEEPVVELFYQEAIGVLKEINQTYEIIFVNDGSKDQTLQKLELLVEKDKNVKIIDFSRNFGKEAAIFAGLKEAKGEFVALLDADLQDPPKLLPEMLAKIIEDGYDSVATYRETRDGEPPIRSFFAKKFYQLINSLIDIEIKDGARDYRLMTREMVNSLITLGEYHRFTKGLMSWVGFNTYYLSFENVERVAGETSWNFWGLVKYAIEGIISFTTKPLKLATYCGLLATIIGFTYMIFIIIQKILYGSDTSGWTSLMVVVIFFSGIQLISVGILGEYIARIYEQIKGRPVYIKKEKREKKEK